MVTMTGERLDDRVKAILSAIVHSYIQSAEPVGSRTLSKTLNMNLSPATIRNIMADLSELGFLEQPHTSAGRVPTDKAYRFFVDSMVAANTVPRDIAALIENTLGRSSQDLEQLLSNTTKLLAGLTKFTGIVAAPRVERTKLRMVEFIKMNSRQVFVVLITQANIVHNKIVEVSEDFTQEFLNGVSEYLNSHFSGQSLLSIRERVMESLAEEKARYDQLLAHVVRLSKKAFELPEASNLYVEGQSSIVRDFPDLEKIQRLLKALEEKISIVRLLDRTVEAQGLQIFIGMENRQEELQDCSVITAQYGAHNHFLGAIGVIGPTRMDYPRVIPIIDYTAKILSQAFSNIA
jgi:heat-inducible transcriptional repressor